MCVWQLKFYPYSHAEDGGGGGGYKKLFGSFNSKYSSYSHTKGGGGGAAQKCYTLKKGRFFPLCIHPSQ